jgi:DNA-binding SARP family transcriptional activator
VIELKSLGGLRLRGPPGTDCESVLAQPKRLTLLVYLALAHRGEHARRDSILALFWPELDEAHARGALRQSVRFLRRALGDGVLVAHGAGDLGVDREALSCDAVAFDRACDAGDLPAAVALYQGDLLQGLFVADAATDLERWIEDERARLRQRAGQSAWELVARYEAKGNTELATEHARRAITLFPQDERGLRHLMTLLERLGDYDGAIRAYQTFHRRLANDFQVEPTPETTALMLRVRSRIGGGPSGWRPAASLSARTAWDEASAAFAAAPALPADGAQSADGGAARSDLAVAERTTAFVPPEPTVALPHAPRRRMPAVLFVVAGVAGLAGFAISKDPITGRPGESMAAPTLAPAPRVPQKSEPPTRDAIANALYLKAQVAWQQHTLAGLKTGAEYLEQAVQRDPGFARAYGMLSLGYTFMPGFGEVPPNEALQQAQAAAHRALELDPTLAEPTYALAQVSAYMQWDWSEADRLFRRALELAPNDAIAHLCYGDFLTASGRLPEGIAEIERAKALDPSSRWVLNDLARRLIWAGEYDRALTELRTALRLQPHFPRGHRTLGVLYATQGRHSDAIDEYAKARDLGGRRPFDLTALADAYVRTGQRAKAEQILAELEARARREYVPPYAIATIYVSLGRTDAAFIWLDRAADAHDIVMAWTVLHESMLDPIRSDPRFAALLRRMNLPYAGAPTR